MTDGRVHYARNGDIRLAYRVYGDDDATLVWVPTAGSRIDYYDDPSHPWGAMVRALQPEMRSSYSTGGAWVCQILWH